MTSTNRNATASRRPLKGDLLASRRVVEREAQRLARLDATRIAEELRELRLGLRVSQSAVARLVGVSQSVISDLEHGDPTVRLEVRRRAAIVLGADLRIGVYPGATPLLHDTGHARIIERLLEIRHRRWRPDVEARVPGPGRASTDLRLSAANTVILIEVETHVRRWEATVRHCLEKRERVQAGLGDGVQVFIVLCLPPTRHHRALVAEFAEYVQASFPTPSDLIRRALEDGTDWPGDGILWMAGGPSPRRPGRQRPESLGLGWAQDRGPDLRVAGGATAFDPDDQEDQDDRAERHHHRRREVEHERLVERALDGLDGGGPAG